MNNNDGAINFRVGLDNSQLQADAARANAQLRGIGNTATVEGSRMGNAFNAASGYIAMGVMAAGASIGMLGKAILDTTAKFEKFGIVLRNSLGDDKGNDALAMIADFAATTPFQLDEVTAAFIKMANQGFVPTRDEMVKLGDVASSTGKTFDQLAEAMLDAQTGEFERLKEFGIKARANGDKVTFSFKEQKTTVDNTNSAIQGYILSLGELNGVAGANAKISESLTGQMSNLGDKLAAMYNQIGSENKGILYSVVGTAAIAIDNYEAIGEAIGVLIGIYGAYRLAVMFVAREQGIMAAANLLVVESNGFLVASEARAIVMAERHLIAQNAVNTSMLANPYVLAAMAVVALGYAIYKVINLESDLEKSQKALNETVAGYMTSVESERMALDALFGRLKAAKEGTDEYKEAKKAIFANYGEQLKSLGDESTALNDVAIAYKTISEEAMKSARARGMAKATNEAAETASVITSKSKTDVNKLLVDKFGSANGSEIFYKIIPVIEGKSEITAEIQDILKQFDTTIYPGGGGMFAQNVAIESNALSDLLKISEKANAQFKKTLADAEIAFAGAKSTEPEKVKEYITAEQQRIDLRKQLAVETEKLNKLETKKFEVGKDKAPLAEIAAQEATIEGIKKQLGIKEKAAKQEKEAIKSTVEASKEYIDVQNQIIVKIKELDKANSSSHTEEGLRIVAEIDLLEKKKQTLITGTKLDPRESKVTTTSTPLDTMALAPMKLLTDEERKQLELKADMADMDAKAADDAKEQSEYFYQIADSAKYLSQQIGDSNQGLADMLVGVSNIAGQFGDLISKGAFSKKGMSTTDAIGSAISGATQLIGMFAGQAAENKRVMEDYYSSVIKQQNDYNLSLNEQMRISADINASPFYNDFKGRISGAASALKDATARQNEAMAKFYSSEAITGKKNVVSGGNILGGIGSGAAAGAGIGALIGGGVLSLPAAAAGAIIGGIVGAIGGLFAKKKKDIVAPLLETYPALIKANGDFNVELAKTLVANDKVTKETKATLENIIKWDEAAKAAEAQIVQIIGDMAGSLGDDLRNSLVDAFENGTDAAVKFGESVKKVLEDLLSRQIFNAVFGPVLDQLTQDMKISSGAGRDDKGNLITGAGVDGSWVDDISRFLVQVPALTTTFNDTMSAVQKDTNSTISGLDIFDKGAASNNSMQGRISAAITEDTATELVGLWNRTALDIRETLNMSKASSNHLLNIAANTLRTADNTDQLSDMKVSLKNIETATNKTASRI